MPPYRYAEPDVNPYAASIGELLARQNEGRARAMDISGQAWGRAFQQAGQIGADTVGAIMQERHEAPLRAQEAEINRLKLTEAREGVEAKRARRQRDRVFMHWIGQGKEPTPREMLSIGFSPDEVVKYGQGMAAFEALATKKTADARADVGRVANSLSLFGSEIQAGMWPQLRQKATEAGFPGELPEAPNSEAVNGVLAWSTGRDIAKEQSDAAAAKAKDQREAMKAMEDIAAKNRDDQRQDRVAASTIQHQRAMEANAAQRPATEPGWKIQTVTNPTTNETRMVRVNERTGEVQPVELPEGMQPGGQRARRLTAAQQEDLSTMKTVFDLATLAETVGEEIGWKGVGGMGTGSVAGWAAKNLGMGTEKEENLRNYLGNIQGTIAKLRGGASFTVHEKTMLDTYTPTINDSDKMIQSKLKSLREFIVLKQKNTLEFAGANIGGEQGDLSWTSPDGQAFTFPTKAALDAFKREAGVQ